MDFDVFVWVWVWVFVCGCVHVGVGVHLSPPTVALPPPLSFHFGYTERGKSVLLGDVPVAASV